MHLPPMCDPLSPQHDFKKPVYAVEPYTTRTGYSNAYAPKGAWSNFKPRSWQKYEAWKPQ